jgi:predicted transposase YbfD/YdcC
MQQSFADHFITVTDPRQDNRTHLLIDIIMIAICATIAGAEGWIEIARFGQLKEAWFRKFLALPNGIPSHDTIGRVFSLLDPEQFQISFVAWIRSAVTLTNGQIIAIDGKTNRHTFGKDTKPLHLVSAFATANGVALGSVATHKKSNEITAIPKLLKLLDISGCVITTDAMGCQTDIAADIVDQGGDYLLAVKGNQGLLYRDIKAVFDTTDLQTEWGDLLKTNTTEDRNHGRIELRRCEVLSGSDVIAKLRHKNNWLGLITIVKVTATRTIVSTGEVTLFSRYYISSLKDPSAEYCQQAVRQHWGIENSLHWVLDMSFREDESRIRTDHGPQNMAILRHIALDLIKLDKDRKVGVKASIKKAGWDENYLGHLLGV